jgi:hypothetical protein
MMVDLRKAYGSIHTKKLIKILWLRCKTEDGRKLVSMISNLDL